MSKLDSLNVLPVLFHYGWPKKTIQLTPVKFKNLKLFDQVSHSVIDVVSCEDKKVLKKYRRYIDHFNSVGSGLQIDKVNKLSIKNSLRLLNAIFDVNKALFVIPSKEAKGESKNWFDIIQTLISSGHTFSEIQEYNYSQIMGFIESVENNRKDESRLDLILMRAAQSDEKGFTAIMKSLTRTKDGKIGKKSQQHKPKKQK